MERVERIIYSIKEKAVKINIEDNVYGSIAEIGGGQEVARTFFQAGGASETVAKSISAYDKTFSDYYYNNNEAGRYVSQDRLVKMLDKEYQDLQNVLSDRFDDKTSFFAFADTVETLNYKKTNNPHGWMGVRFQGSDRENPNEVKIHFRLLEKDTNLQQYTLGTVGVNLIFACFHHIDSPNFFLQSLMDNLDSYRIEIDMVSMKGPDLDYVDNRLLGVQMVKNGMTNVVMFDKDGNITRPADMVYKKNVIAIRGSFRPITYVGFDMIKTAIRTFKKEGSYDKKDTLVFCEITMRNLMSSGEFDDRDFLARVDILNGMNQNVMVSNYRYYYKLTEYFNQFTIKKLRMVVGVPTLKNLVQKKYYEDLKGGIMEAFGILFAENVKLYIYPLIDNKRLQTGKLLNVDEDMFYLYQHLINNDKIVDLENVNRRWQGIFAREVLLMIQNNEEGWEEKMPKLISKQIKKYKLFGYSDSN
ncbi:MAG: TonB-dependent receptor [Bacteroidetes bacterium]|nr:MAG: TonB-dependent receptor [Bacteroidota bacterium]